MGNFYLNTAIASDDLAGAAETLRAKDIGGYVGRVDGWVLVTEPMIATLEAGGITRAAGPLSAALGAPALALINHVSDSLRC
jgi:hypothetical protein